MASPTAATATPTHVRDWEEAVAFAGKGTGALRISRVDLGSMSRAQQFTALNRDFDANVRACRSASQKAGQFTGACMALTSGSETLGTTARLGSFILTEELLNEREVIGSDSIAPAVTHKQWRVPLQTMAAVTRLLAVYDDVIGDHTTRIEAAGGKEKADLQQNVATLIEQRATLAGMQDGFKAMFESLSAGHFNRTLVLHLPRPDGVDKSPITAPKAAGGWLGSASPSMAAAPSPLGYSMVEARAHAPSGDVKFESPEVTPGATETSFKAFSAVWGKNQEAFVKCMRASGNVFAACIIHNNAYLEVQRATRAAPTTDYFGECAVAFARPKAAGADEGSTRGIDLVNPIALSALGECDAQLRSLALKAQYIIEGLRGELSAMDAYNAKVEAGERLNPALLTEMLSTMRDRLTFVNDAKKGVEVMYNTLGKEYLQMIETWHPAVLEARERAAEAARRASAASGGLLGTLSLGWLGGGSPPAAEASSADEAGKAAPGKPEAADAEAPRGSVKERAGALERKELDAEAQRRAEQERRDGTAARARSLGGARAGRGGFGHKKPTR